MCAGRQIDRRGFMRFAWRSRVWITLFSSMIYLQIPFSETLALAEEASIKKEEVKKESADVTGTVTTAKGKQLIFLCSAWPEVKEGAKFIVLSKQEKVVAKVAIKKVAANRKSALADITWLESGQSLESLVNLRVKSAPEEEKTPSSASANIPPLLGDKLEVNPNVWLAATLDSSLSSALNVLTGLDLDQSITSYGVSGEFFLPRTERLEWLNWIGVGGDYSKGLSSKIAMQSSLNKVPQNATLTAEKMQGRLFVRGVLPWRFLRRAGFSFLFLDKRTDSVKVDPNDVYQGGRWKLDSTGFGAVIHLESNPFPGFFVGLNQTLPLQQKVSAADSSGTGSISGKVLRLDTGISFGVRHWLGVLPNSFMLDMKTVISWRNEAYTVGILTGNEKKTQKSFGVLGLVGLGFAH